MIIALTAYGIQVIVSRETLCGGLQDPSVLKRRIALKQMTPTLRFRVIHKKSALVSMDTSFFALPSKQGPVQGRFKPAHLLISLSTRVPACVRHFETPTALNYGRTESKKDVSMLTRALFYV